ncbi:succinyl-diaminopimelate desuccinylase [Caulobacter ginsengisoli]|uniref:Succinyl-diaminopimelate desuccinylase n=1 Tax=Caulobacter ginsengisoli TaxID=400775 RepID=A0ABU0IUG2_9CAUL|nr:acetylornithine deacetylase/succinyl-diaminopimelate desuccinylase family protein [Caulobacter ginsengisoli]MDQ0464597.1 succinyl-diaminopimelate desuccinylase [Caulobacter ginsengisoli]
MSTHPNEAALLAMITGRADELAEITRDLIRFPTINPPGDAYRPCAEYLGERLRKRGFDVQYIRAEGAPGDTDSHPRINVIARYEGGPGPCVHFNSHIDVVEAGEGWTLPPFEGVIRDGKVYGRGACDMKGGLAASVVAVEALLDAGVPIPGKLEISGTADEESGGYGGVAWLAERGWFSRPRVDHVIIPEPLNVDRVCIGHRGVWWGEIETLGRIAHGSMPFLGDSAIRHMGAVVEAFEERLYPRLADHTTVMPVVPDGARTPTLNINSVHGGQAEPQEGRLPSPVVADSCRMVFDRRLLIEEDLEAVKGEMRALLDSLSQTRSGFRYHLRDLFEVRPSMTEPDRPVVTQTARAVQQVLGRPAALVCSPGTYDQKHVDRIGKLRDCIAYGPGILDLAHQPDEYVEIEAMVQSAQVMALSAWALMSGGK